MCRFILLIPIFFISLCPILCEIYADTCFEMKLTSKIEGIITIDGNFYIKCFRKEIEIFNKL